MRKLQARAALIVGPDPKPYFRETVILPPTDLELFFDIEADPLRDLCYLHGFVVRENGDPRTERFVSFFAERESAQDERDAFAAAWDFMQRNREAAITGLTGDWWERSPERRRVCGSDKVRSKARKLVPGLWLTRAEPGSPSYRKSACRWFDSVPGHHFPLVKNSGFRGRPDSPALFRRWCIGTGLQAAFVQASQQFVDHRFRVMQIRRERYIGNDSAFTDPGLCPVENIDWRLCG